jgi:hypothetical protein
MKTTFQSPCKPELTVPCGFSVFSQACFMYTDSIAHGNWLESFLLQAEVFDPTAIQMFS